MALRMLLVLLGFWQISLLMWFVLTREKVKNDPTSIFDAERGTTEDYIRWWKQTKPLWSARFSKKPREEEYFLAGCIVTRGEAHLLRENVVRNIVLVGVEHFFLIVHVRNDSTADLQDWEDMNEIFSPLIAVGLVSLYRSPTPHRPMCWEEFGVLTQWMVYPDSDEFLLELQPDRHSLVSMLESLPLDVPAVYLSSQYYFSNGRLKPPPDGVLLAETYTEYCPYSKMRAYGKVIARCKATKFVGPHYGTFYYGEPVNEDGEYVVESPIHNYTTRNRFIRDPEYYEQTKGRVRMEKFVIGHYWSRSILDFLLKMYRGFWSSAIYPWIRMIIYQADCGGVTRVEEQALYIAPTLELFVSHLPKASPLKLSDYKATIEEQPFFRYLLSKAAQYDFDDAAFKQCVGWDQNPEFRKKFLYPVNVLFMALAQRYNFTSVPQRDFMIVDPKDTETRQQLVNLVVSHCLDLESIWKPIAS